MNDVSVYNADTPYYRVKDLFEEENDVDLFAALCLHNKWRRPRRSIEKALYRRIYQCFGSFCNEMVFVDNKEYEGLYITAKLLKHIYFTFQRKVKVCDIWQWELNDISKTDLLHVEYNCVSIEKNTDLSVRTDRYTNNFLEYLQKRIPAIKETPKRKGTVVSKPIQGEFPALFEPEIKDNPIPTEQTPKDDLVAIEWLEAEVKELKEKLAAVDEAKAKEKTYQSILIDQRKYIVDSVRGVAQAQIERRAAAVIHNSNVSREEKSMFFHSAWSGWHQAVYDVAKICLRRTTKKMKEYSDKHDIADGDDRLESYETNRGEAYIDYLIGRVGWGAGLRIANEALLKLKEKNNV